MNLVLYASCFLAQFGSPSAESTIHHNPSGKLPRYSDIGSSYPSSPIRSRKYGATCQCPSCGRGMPPSSWRIKPTGDLFMHVPYESRPKVYYYDRPYSPSHIQPQAHDTGVGHSIHIHD